VRRRIPRIRVPALALALVGVLLGPSTAGSQTAPLPVSVTVGPAPAGAPMPSGFLGVSLEYGGINAYTGRNPRAVNPVLLHLLAGLAPRQQPVVRIGGNSTDATWWPVKGIRPPGGVRRALTPAWLRTTRAFAADLRAHLIVGVNLAAGRRKLAAAEARALLKGLGRRYVQALEIGNEPDDYNQFPWYRGKHGRLYYARDGHYNLAAYTRQFSSWRAALPRFPLAGPAFAQLTWLSGLDQFLRAEPGLKVVTIHRYPLRAGVTDPSSSIYASIPNLLSDRSSAGLAASIAPYMTVAHARHLQFRVDELNSASSSGQHGVSDTFASALWMLDTLFNMANAGVDGVNVHSLPGARYELFSFSKPHGRWQAFVHPDYYGMLMFTQAFPVGARLLQTTVPSGPLKVWATSDRSGRIRVALINKDTANGYQVQLQVPGADTAGQATVERLTAPSVGSTGGVTLGGQTFGSQTRTGTLPGPPRTDPALPVGGSYSITVPPASAALLTQAGPSGGVGSGPS
jgi:hypothetical protein